MKPDREKPTPVKLAPLEPIRLAAGLYVVATPIGNLTDVSIRALSTLASADLVLCEDTRITRRLLDRYGLAPSLLAYHDHNAASVRPKILAKLAEGAAVALVSDAGTPLVSDPGYKLVQAAIGAGHKVFPVPGASAALAALVVAGLPTDRFFFEGFLPAKSGQRKNRVAELAAIPATLVFYETGPRLAESLADLSTVLGARSAAVCRELTKSFEEVRRGSLAELASHYKNASEPKGEIVLVIGPSDPDAEKISDAQVDALLGDALKKFSVKDAASLIANETGLSRREIYQRALALADGKKR
jgi:16S rRNA (cytidine1402-2'-O)-methyltransferase